MTISDEAAGAVRGPGTDDKIRDLRHTLTSVLDNMPGLTFSKDAETGVYTSCNQAFAVFAHKTCPEEVIGLTDAQLFDPAAAERIAAGDRAALTMDKPYVFVEDVPDKAGHMRRIQITKLKIVDKHERPGILGMCLDVTDAERIERENAAIREENATIREAFAWSQSTATIYSHIAQALARGYTDLYYVNMETDELIEFHTDDELGVLTEARRSADFFEGCERDVKLFVHPEDQEKFVRTMNRAFLEEKLEQTQVYEMTYRRIKDGRSFYVRMRISRVRGDERFIVIAVSDIDELVRTRRAEERMMEERVIYARLHALTGNFIVVYVVDPETSRYREFSATADYVESFAQAKEGTGFFDKVRDVAKTFNHPEDLPRFLSLFTRENVLAEVGRGGIFTLGYRLLVGEEPRHVQLKAAMVEEKEGPRLVVGINDIDAQVRQAEEYERRLAEAQSQANIDALTGIKNKHAFLEAEARLDRRIAEHRNGPFAIVFLDVNDLKRVNDTAGHQAGDQLIRGACKIICDTFKHSPVFRVGGDEFAVISQGHDYDHVEELVAQLGEHNAQARGAGGIVVACGMARYENDSCVAAVFERADQNMYKNKAALKAAG